MRGKPDSPRTSRSVGRARWAMVGAAALGFVLVFLDSDERGPWATVGVLLAAPLIATGLAAGWRRLVRYMIER